MKRCNFIFPLLIVCLLDTLFAQSLSDNFSMPMWSYNKPHPYPNDDWYNLFKPIKLNEKYKNVKSISVSEAGKSTRYNYDNKGNLKTIEKIIGEKIEYTISLKYDDKNRITLAHLSGYLNERNEFTYNDKGLLIRNEAFLYDDSLNSDNQYLTHTFEYDSKGRIIKILQYAKKLRSSSETAETELIFYWTFTYDNLRNEYTRMMEQRYNAINDEWQQTFIYSHKNWGNPQKYQTFENGELVKDNKIIKSIYLFNYDRDGNYLGYEYKLWDKVEKSLKYNYDTNGLLISSEEYVWNPNWGGKLEKTHEYKFEFTF